MENLRVAHDTIRQQILELFKPSLLEVLAEDLEPLVFALNLAQLVIIRRVLDLMHAVIVLVLLMGELLLEVYAVPVALNELKIIDLLRDVGSLLLFD